ncbi:hypothetical protein ACFOET_01395 [Parapedobacter deserti]|uniref:Uncharacterized protein n=2 Tax=Parapedobacter deserti TaxID=1912957 RepID=A0ABV7JLP2_9SPHI
MDITLLLIAIALLDVAMLCYSVYLDRKIGELKGIGPSVGHAYPIIRIGRFERFVHSPLGSLLLAVCFIGSLIAMREAEKQAGSPDARQYMGETVPEGWSMAIPCADEAEARSGQLAGR